MQSDYFQMFVTFGIIILTVFSFVWGRLPPSVTSLTSLVLLLLFFWFFPLSDPEKNIALSPINILSGFSNPALITVLSLLIVGQGLFQSDALQPILVNILRFGPRLAAFIAFTVVCFASGLINNTPVVVMFLPIISSIAVEMRISMSKFAMPLSFMAILGGMITLIGSSTNLLVADIAHKNGVEINFFSLLPIGGIIAFVGFIYTIIFVPRILSKSPQKGTSSNFSSGKQFIVNIKLQDDHSLVGAKPIAGMFTQLEGMTVLTIHRVEEVLTAPYDEVTLLKGDRLVIASTLAVLTKNVDILFGSSRVDNNEKRDDVFIVEALVPPGSQYMGHTVENIDINYLSDCQVIGVQRRVHMMRHLLIHPLIQAGDMLLLKCTGRSMKSLRANHNLVLFEWARIEIKNTDRQGLAQLIFGSFAFCAIFNILPTEIAAMTAALIMLLTGCITMRQARRALDLDIFMVVGASIAIANALDATGGAIVISNLIVSLTSGMSPVALVSALFLAIALLTNLVSNNATAVLFTPIVINMAAQTGLPKEALVLAVIFAANSAFASPIGYQTNMLVLSAGSYNFSDFIKAGLPLVIITWITFTICFICLY